MSTSQSLRRTVLNHYCSTTGIRNRGMAARNDLSESTGVKDTCLLMRWDSYLMVMKIESSQTTLISNRELRKSIADEY